MGEKHKPMYYNICMPIHLLPPQIASQIAAGEVVERPASVVKELLENSLDARAKQITIHIREAGQRLVEISDDGYGIPAGEISLRLKDATRQTYHADDLFNVATLGFGQALASIGSVSRMTIISRAARSPSGVRMVVEGGTQSP
jgi:DNA mismatch repair protein MutL